MLGPLGFLEKGTALLPLPGPIIASSAVRGPARARPPWHKWELRRYQNEPVSMRKHPPNMVTKGEAVAVTSETSPLGFDAFAFCLAGCPSR